MVKGLHYAQRSGHVDVAWQHSTVPHSHFSESSFFQHLTGCHWWCNTSLPPYVSLPPPLSPLRWNLMGKSGGSWEMSFRKRFSACSNPLSLSPPQPPPSHHVFLSLWRPTRSRLKSGNPVEWSPSLVRVWVPACVFVFMRVCVFLFPLHWHQSLDT